MGMDDQEIIFKYFSATMDALIAAAKSTGRFEHGPITLQASGVAVARRDIIHQEPGTGAASCISHHLLIPLRLRPVWSAVLPSSKLYAFSYAGSNVHPVVYLVM